jgi:hypothetical protein
MNKTRRRALQKHRAKEAKYTLRRKAEAEQQGGTTARARATAGGATAAATRPKSASRRRAEAADVAEPASEAAE